MRALDLFMEKNANDGGSDIAVSRVLSREVNELDWKSQLSATQQAGQDKVSFATASLCLGAPFMLFGLGAAILEEFGSVRQERQLNQLQNEQRRFALRKGEERRELHAEKRPLETKLSTAMMSVDMVGRKPRKGKAGSDISSKSVFSDARMNRMRPFLAVGKNWLDMKRLAKRKQFLLDQIERLNNGRHYSLIAKLHSKLELLDKTLKRLGC